MAGLLLMNSISSFLSQNVLHSLSFWRTLLLDIALSADRIFLSALRFLLRNLLMVFLGIPYTRWITFLFLFARFSLCFGLSQVDSNVSWGGSLWVYLEVLQVFQFAYLCLPSNLGVWGHYLFKLSLCTPSDSLLPFHDSCNVYIASLEDILYVL